MNMDAEMLKNILVNYIQRYVKGIIYGNQMGLVPGMQDWSSFDFNQCHLC